MSDAAVISSWLGSPSASASRNVSIQSRRSAGRVAWEVMRGHVTKRNLKHVKLRDFHAVSSLDTKGLASGVTPRNGQNRT